MKPVHVVADDVAQDEGQDEDHGYFLKYHEECLHESDFGAFLEHGEYQRNEQGGGQGGHDGEGGDGVDIAAQLIGYHGGCRGAGGNDACEDAFPEDALLDGGAVAEDDPYVEGYEQQLGSEDAELPAMGEHLVEIYLAEGDEQREEHADGEEHVEEGPHRVAQRIEGRGEIAGEVAHCAHGDGHGQRPVSQKSYKFLHNSSLFTLHSSLTTSFSS